MRIVHLSLLAPPNSIAASGVPKVCGTLLREYENLGPVEVHAITLVDGALREESVRRKAVTYHYLPCRRRGKTWTLYLPEINRLTRAIFALRPDIVHAQPTAEYLLAGSRRDFPHVLTLHGLINKESAGFSRWHPVAFANQLRDWCQRRALRRARNLIACSDYITDYARGRTEATVWRIPNPIDREFFDLGDAERRGLRILAAGVVSPRKNQIQLVEACAALKRRGVPFECRIIGPILRDADASLRGLIRTEGLERDIRLKGMVFPAELLEDYAWSNAVALASREETMPLSLMQALCGGRPVFGARSGGIPVLLSQGKHGTLFEDAADLAAHFEAFHRDPAPFFARAEAAARHAAREYHPRAVAEKTLATYEKIANS